jgi:hypothetical protein
MREGRGVGLFVNKYQLQLIKSVLILEDFSNL